jgi:hypothetical protein
MGLRLKRSINGTQFRNSISPAAQIGCFLRVGCTFKLGFRIQPNSGHSGGRARFGSDKGIYRNQSEPLSEVVDARTMFPE